MPKPKIKILKLNPCFFHENQHLQDVLDKIHDRYPIKERGYGVVTLQFNHLLFAIPLRSHPKTKSSFVLNPQKKSGLDFTKAVLITDRAHLSEIPFMIPRPEYDYLEKNAHRVTVKFEKYVKKYCRAVEKDDVNILQSPDYRFSTLINYHKALGLSRRSKQRVVAERSRSAPSD